MSTNPNSASEDQELSSALSEIDAALGGGQAAGATESAAEGFNPCDEYNKIRDILPTVIKLAEKIPFGVGKRIADVLRKVKAILDALCPQRESAGGAAG